MKTKVVATALLFLSFACDGDDNQITGPIDGTYVGTFGRSSPHARYESSEVTLVLQGNTFTGSSSKPQYPAICEGTYSVTGQDIEFVNQCVWTADFDWTYILSGTFRITQDGDELLLIKSYDDSVSDTYRLKKQ